MKITCPHCQAKYQVNLPSLGEAGVDVKCARCQETFRVREEASRAVAAATPAGTGDSVSGSPADDAESRAEESEAPETGGELDDDLDALLDDLIEKEISGKGTAPVPAAPAESSENLAEETDNLDELLDDLLTETDLPPTEQNAAETLKEAANKTPGEPAAMNEEALDTIWEEAVEEGQREEPSDTPDPPAAEADVDETPVETAADPEAVADGPAAESPEAEAATPTAAAAGEGSEEDLWSEAFADQEAVEAGQAAESPDTQAAAPAETPEGQDSEEDLWAKAFADQAEVEADQSGEPSGETEPVVAAKATDATESEEDLWAQAFGEAEKEETAGAEAPEAEDLEEGEQEESETGLEDTPEEELEGLASLQPDEGGLGLADEAMAGYREEDYADDENEEFETEAPAKKLGPLPLPTSKTGKLIVGGSVLALALVAGSAYFAIQTFAPPELTDEAQIADTSKTPPEPSPVAEKPKEQSPDPAAGQNKKAVAPAPGPVEKKVADKTTAVEKAQAQLLGDSPEEGAAKTVPPPSQALGSALQPFAAVVEMSTIMPVAYNAKDIKVLSFTLQLEMDTPQAAQGIRDSLPVYEKIMVSTVESFLKRKFYDDILYVKEKLVKRLELAINKGLKNGKVSKAKFKEFQIS